MIRYTFLLVLLIPSVLSEFPLVRYKRRTGDQPQAGKCNSFHWGGTSGLHFYICCNNCNGDTSCDGTTYHTASTGNYCDTCGEDNSKGNGKLKTTFSCGGCSGQESVSRRCRNSLNTIPGFCWAFTWCFKRRCRKQYSQSKKRSVSDVPDTCFNKVCDSGETVNNCPEDCCQTVTEKCDWIGSNCIPECCGDSACCRSGGSKTGLSETMEKTLIIFFTFIAAKISLLGM